MWSKQSAVWMILSVLMLNAIIVGGCGRKVQRYGSVIGIPKESISEYKELHANCWPGVLKQIEKSNIENYSIYLGEVEPGEFYLFSYFEYTGGDFKADMDKMGKDETTQEWWKRTDPLQKPLPTREDGQWWANWKEVFHYEGSPYKGKPTKRVGGIIGMPEENILAYTQMHETVWSGVLASIERCNIRNYSIYLGEIEKDDYLLFSYFEYIGDDFDGDMEKIGDEVTKTWWTYTDPLQRPLSTRKPGEHWATMEEVFHAD